nr:hypothetical protein [Tanacetum cinerariifolium]
VLDRNYSSTKQVNFIQQLLAYSLITRTEDEVQESDEKVLAAGDDMYKDHQDDKVRTPSPKQYHSEPSHVQEYASDDLKRFENILPLTEWQLIMYLRKMSRTALKREMFYLRQDTFEIKSIMTERYAAFQGRPSLTPSGSFTPTLALIDIQANVKGENATTTATEEPPSHTEGET